MSKRIFYTLSIIAIATVLFFACSKKQNASPTTTSGSLYVISNTALANATDTIQAVSFDTKNNVTWFFYGSFDASGNPLQLLHAAVRHGNTVLNFLFDSAFHVNELYCTVAGVPDTTVFSFAYYTDSVALITYHTNWQANDMVLRSITKVSTANGNYSFISNKAYRTTGLASIANYINEAGYAPQAIKVCDFVINAGKVGIVALGGGVLLESGWVAEGVGLAIDNSGAIGLAIGAYEAPASANTTQVSSFDNLDDPSTNQPVIQTPDPVDLPKSTTNNWPIWTFNLNINSSFVEDLDGFNAGSFCQYENPGTGLFSAIPTGQLHFRSIWSDGYWGGVEVLIPNFVGVGVYNISYPVPTNSTSAYELFTSYSGGVCDSNILYPCTGQINITNISTISISGYVTLNTETSTLFSYGCYTGIITDALSGSFVIPLKQK